MDTRRHQPFLYQNNLLLLNPHYQNPNAAPLYYQPPVQQQCLAYVSTEQQIALANEVMATELKLHPAAEAAIKKVKDPDYRRKLQAMDDLNVLEELSKLFAQYQMPIGMLAKLLQLTDQTLHIIVDDSGSMSANKTDCQYQNATEYVKKRGSKKHRTMEDYMTRWEEAEDRLHLMIDILSYIPAKVKITFLNRKDTIELEHKKHYDPKKYKKNAHDKIKKAFKKPPEDHHLTPIYDALKKAFEPDEKVFVYLMTDGSPTAVADETKEMAIEKVKKLIIERGNGDCSKFPLTIISCTSNDKEIAWVKKFEDMDGIFVSEVDDPKSEHREVLAKQGITFPYNFGVWIVSIFVAANNPHDLDALDGRKPFTWKTLNEYMGRMLSVYEYQFYYQNHSLGKERPQYYQFYANLTIVAAQLDHKELNKQLKSMSALPNAQAALFSQTPNVQQQPQPQQLNQQPQPQPLDQQPQPMPYPSSPSY